MKKESSIIKRWENAKVITGVVTSAMLSFISLAVCMVISFLGMLFESGADGKRTCFFDTLYFESVTGSDGAVTMSMGFTGTVFPILFWLIAVFLFCFISFYFAKRILIYRQRLIEEMNEANI